MPSNSEQYRKRTMAGLDPLTGDKPVPEWAMRAEAAIWRQLDQSERLKHGEFARTISSHAPLAEAVILRAASFANKAHAGQLRKWFKSPEPYVLHCGRVASIVSMAPWGTVDAVCAAWLHDVIEDTGFSSAEIKAEFGPRITGLVVELTNTSKLTDGNRRTRKELDWKRIATVSPLAKKIKLCDRIDNILSCDEAPADWRTLYAEESEQLLRVLCGTDVSLEETLSMCIAKLRGAQ